MSSSRVRNLIMIVVLLSAVILISDPFGNFAFTDDFSYSSMALRWAQTGHIHFNGWNTSALLLQMPLGGLLIRIFGFSFDALKSMTVLFYVAWALIVYFFLLACEISDNWALFGTLASALSPLTIPLAGSFMTDIYGCFTFYLSLLFGVYAFRSSASILRASLWLTAANAIGILGGTNRQIVWLAPLALLLAAVACFRKQRALLLVVCANFVLFSASIKLLMSWLKGQPNFQYDAGDFAMLFARHALINFIRYLLTCFLFSLPFFAAVCSHPVQMRGKGRRIALSVVLSAVLATALLAITPHLSPGSTGTTPTGEAPWTGSMVTIYGILGESADLLGHRPIVVGHSVRIGFTVLCIFAAVAFAVAALNRRNVRRVRQVFSSEFSLARALLLALVLAGFFALILERISPFDRYIVQILPILFLLAVVLLPAPTKPHALGWLVLVFFAFVGIANTHDYAATRRASLRALSQLEQMGVDRYQVTAGLELDGFDHLLRADSLRVCTANPPAGGPGCSNDFAGDWKTWWFRKTTFTISGEYAISYSDLPGYARVDGMTENFKAWMPPFQRQIFGLKRNTNAASSANDAVQK